MRFRFRVQLLSAAAVVILFATGCAGSRLKNARDAFITEGDPQAAVQILEEDGDTTGRSALLFHMEKGLLLHESGRFNDSIAELRQASELMQKQDYLSVGQQTASMLVNDWMTDYKGEYCERLWVHTYLIINYFLIHRYEDALVEAKQALRIFDTYPEALSEAYFSMALIGLCYETLHEFNDAYIVYKRLSKMMPDPSPVCEKLLQMGRLSGIDDPVDCKRSAPDSGKNPGTIARAMGEVVLFVGMGNSPVKKSGNIIIPPGIRFSFPRYENRNGNFGRAEMYQKDSFLPSQTATTDLGQVARTSLAERAKQIIIKETARVVAKEAIIREVGKENDAIVALMTRLAIIAMEEPDTRCWQTLPAGNSLLRLRLPQGTHHLTVSILGGHINQSIELPPIILKKGQRVFFSARVNDNYFSVYGGSR